MLSLKGLVTRRSFYFIPVKGEPTGLVHAIEADKFIGVPGKIITYSGYKVLEQEIKKLLPSPSKVAMEYSPSGRLPYIGLVDAG